MTTDSEKTPRKVLFGDETEWDDFDRRNPEFANRVGNLVHAIQVAFATLTLQEPVDKVLFHLNRLCGEDFSEILLLCGNGYGIGAEKLLRGMYERAVTATYLHDNPTEVDNFLEYHKISAYKLMNATIETLGDHGLYPAYIQADFRFGTDFGRAVVPRPYNGGFPQWIL